MMNRAEPPRATATVVVVTCGAAQTTSACLRSVARTDYSSLQLVVVNNGGGRSVDDALRDFARQVRTPGDLKVVTNEVNVGACSARNQALARADGEYVAFLDNDIICRDPGWLTRLTDMLSSDPSLGVVGPRIVREVRPHRLECAGYAVSPNGQLMPLGAGCGLEEPLWRRRRVVQGVGNFVAATATVRGVGGFDTAFDPFGFENVDCCYRVKQAGLNVSCDGETDLYHVGQVTTGQFNSRRKIILFEKSLLLRKRWASVFRAEAELFEVLASLGRVGDEEGIR